MRVRRHYYHVFDQLCVIEDNKACIIIFLPILFLHYFFANIFAMSINSSKKIKIFNHVTMSLCDTILCASIHIENENVCCQLHKIAHSNNCLA
jgi:hypothetical protein